MRSHMPARAVPEPNLDGHVFCRVMEDKGDVEIDACVRIVKSASHRTVGCLTLLAPHAAAAETAPLRCL